MTLTTVNSSTSLSTFNTSIPLPMQPSRGVVDNISSCQSRSLTDMHLFVTKELFVHSLHQQASQEGRGLKLHLLSEIFNRIIQGQDESVKQALSKRDGYLYRLFSNESWEEWLEQRTALGKVVDVFVNYVENGFSNEGHLPIHLSVDTIHRANTQAENLLKQLSHASDQGTATLSDNPKSTVSREADCSVGLFLGAVGSVATQNPLPIELASLNCISVVSAKSGAAARVNAHRAQAIKNVGAHRPGPQRANTVSITQNPTARDNREAQVRMQVFEDIQENVPRSLLAKFKTDTGWFDYIVLGVDIFLNTVGVTTPMNVFMDQMDSINRYYWTRTVAEEYYTIFPDLPQMCCSSQACYDGEIQGMRDKLKSHGYMHQLYDPIEFIRLLKAKGVCERTSCLN